MFNMLHRFFLKLRIRWRLSRKNPSSEGEMMLQVHPVDAGNISKKAVKLRNINRLERLFIAIEHETCAKRIEGFASEIERRCAGLIALGMRAPRNIEECKKCRDEITNG